MKERGISSRAAAAYSVWGNWYIRRSSHEFGWATQYACLNYYGAMNASHKILFDTPESVRIVDLALGALPELLRRAMVLGYVWHRDLITGQPITDRMRAESIGASSPSQYREVLRTAKWLGQQELEVLDYRRHEATIRNTGHSVSAA